MDDHGSTRFNHLAPGHNIDQVDQLSSVVLMGLAIAGAAVALLLTALL
ncbi:hypothetical protein [Methylobacterium persicinum]|uniref:Uncharacterized protein n=1 Tax=Methylobacterium persicinum TaxID=374426 RepID=A0ABU0HKP1_9HYPH|nr:hypothetical protein [Methylobacterium persicinum]MDQ0442879.1 hypothetical protein [Methylobacterium persicinum]GJE37373.1 hypothetical protein KHHGKMAE_1429 [Methylobacterium persicinum]